MKRQHWYAAMLALGLSAQASGAEITIGFGGSVDNDPYATGWGSFTGLFTYDSSWQDVNPGAHTGTYHGVGPNYGISIDFLGGASHDLYGSLFSLSILNDYAGLGDGYLVLGDDGAGTRIELNLYDSLAALFGSDLLPTEAPNLDAFDWPTFALFSPDLEIGGSLDSLVCISGCGLVDAGNGDVGGSPGNGDNGDIPGGNPIGTVPEPGSLWLIGLGFWAAGYVSRYKDAKITSTLFV